MNISPSLRHTLSLLWGSVIMLLIALLAYKEHKTIEAAFPYLTHANLLVAMVTIVCEWLYFALQALAAKQLYQLYNCFPRWSVLLGMLVHATMLNEVMPTSGASGTAGFIFWGERFGLGLRNSIAVSVWMTLLSYLALLPLVLVCLRVLVLLPGEPQSAILEAEKGFAWFLVAFTLLGLLWLFYVKRMKQETISEKARLDGPIARFISKVQNKLHWYTNHEVRKEWIVIKSHPLRMMTVVGLLFAIYPVRVGMLMICFLALHHPIDLSVAIYTYSLTLLFSVVSLAPTTLGVVEVALTTALRWFGVPLPIALAGTLLYRIPSFWLPILAGLLYQAWLTKQISQDIQAP
ncbi:lysylphosphatidylglycerol synthase transmembrane domain-containing protein [Sulfoacidibacillus thermotolerans]|uniref:Phosphatidylglycerol lysyltransferase n=1 Tax=Sulfoacidibacillus thermotolerans TaxID=1765684 RepID=A0A2U3DAL3_SULT2|nr:lysylphosphatidylglycerol synthase transmembrane domain-containing protein [Sulfoacidibacillus thermotolerans]PWI58330.1 hypothetical protein BM613_03680 [Sulfoacidibacillus thermotolerans]